MMHHYSPHSVWNYLLREEEGEGESVNVFMAVPTLYAGLINYYEARLSNRK